MYSEAKVLHEVLKGSDHAMLILDMDVMSLKRWRWFIYDPRWNKEKECHNTVEENWRHGFVGSRAFQVVEKLKWVHKGLQN